MLTKKVNGKSVELSLSEEATILEERAAFDPTVELRKQLEAVEKDKALEVLITSQKAQINNMNETALKTAIVAGGI